METQLQQEANGARAVLKEVFGYAAFRGPQEEIVHHVAAGGDCLVLMPTGGGKSLCYQIPALLRPGTGIVVSPLIALMQDQVAALREAGVRAAFLNSSLSTEEAGKVERGLAAGDYDLLYVAPERLLMPRFLAQLERLHAAARLALFAIDEAHCVSQWGHDFRPEYMQLALLHERFPGVPRIALTATADRVTRDEIVQRLGLDGARQFVASFDRPNIRYRIVEKANARAQLLAFLRAEHAGEAGIVYCLSRRKVEETAAWLAEQGVAALPYHAGMDADTRSLHQARFQREEGIVMVATIAFGMGIDKPDVRFVAHLDLPEEHRGLLPGDRPRRPRRPAGRRVDGLRPGRRGQPAAHDRRLDRRARSSSASPRPSSMRCSGCAKRAAAAACACCPTSTKPLRPAAIAMSASNRRRSGTAPWRRKRRCPASIAPDSASARCT